MNRTRGRMENELRPVNIIPHFTEMAAGSVLPAFFTASSAVKYAS